MSPVISLLHTTAQPGTCEATAFKWLEACADSSNVEHVMAWENKFFGQAPESPFYNSKVFSVSGSPVVGWNACAALAEGRIYVMMSDDLYPSLDWDKEILAAVQNDLAEAVVWVTTLDDDGNNLWPDIITHPVVTKTYVDRNGYFLHPAYFARFSDLEFSDKAKQDGVVIDKRGEIFWRHENHQVVGDWHASTDRINALHMADNETYRKRSDAGFPKEWEAFKPL